MSHRFAGRGRTFHGGPRGSGRTAAARADRVKEMNRLQKQARTSERASGGRAPRRAPARAAIRVRIVSFRRAEADIRSVRDAVFGREQRVPRALDWDGADADCVQALARTAGGRAIGTGRLRADGKIGRMAVRRRWRGRGVGTRILLALIAAARRRGLRRVYLHAQLSAAAFYARHGFVARGPRFREAGIPHVRMRRRVE